MKVSERNFARRIDLTSLQLFVAVCELGSIGRAAEKRSRAAFRMAARVASALRGRGAGQNNSGGLRNNHSCNMAMSTGVDKRSNALH